MVTRKKSASSRKAAKSGGRKGGRTVKPKPPAAKPHVAVAGSKRPPAPGAIRLRDANPRSNVKITITLRGPKLPSPAELAGRALSPKQFKVRYGASKRDTDKVTQLLRKRGLTIDEVSRETRSIRASGTGALTEAIFHPGLAIYESAEQGEFRDRAS